MVDLTTLSDEELQIRINATNSTASKLAPMLAEQNRRRQLKEQAALERADRQHQDKMKVDRQRNAIALWALFISAVALIVAVVALVRTMGVTSP